MNRGARVNLRPSYSPSVPLGSVPSGGRAIVVRLEGGDRMSARLAGLGILPGARVEVLKDGRVGPLVVLVSGARLALGRGLANRIMVRATG